MRKLNHLGMRKDIREEKDKTRQRIGHRVLLGEVILMAQEILPMVPIRCLGVDKYDVRAREISLMDVCYATS